MRVLELLGGVLGRLGGVMSRLEAVLGPLGGVLARPDIVACGALGNGQRKKWPQTLEPSKCAGQGRVHFAYALGL